MKHQHRKDHQDPNAKKAPKRAMVNKSKKTKNLPGLQDQQPVYQIKVSASDQDIERLFQVIPQDLMTALITAMNAKGSSLEEEVTLRLTATVIERKAFRINPELEGMLANKLNNHAQAELEQQLCRRGWGYIYEREKLKLLITHERVLPKDYEENFAYLDPKKEAKLLRKELKRHHQKNKGNDQGDSKEE